MGWFDEQLKERKIQDERAYRDSVLGIAGALLGRDISAEKDDKRITGNAINEILKFYHVDAGDINLASDDINEILETCMRPYGIMRRQVRLIDSWYKDAIGAMLGTLAADGTKVALIPDAIEGYYYNDAVTGKKVHINSKNKDLISQEAICFYKPFPLRSINFKDILKYVLNLLSFSDYAFTIAASLLVAVMGTITPKISYYIFGVIVPSKSVNMLMAVSVVLVSATISAQLIETSKSLAVARISTKIENSVSAASMMRLLSLSPDFFTGYSSGELYSYQSRISTICTELVDSFFSLGLSSLASLVYVYQIYQYASGLAGTAVIIVLANVAVSIVSSIVEMKILNKQMTAGAKESGLAYELIAGIEKIKLAGAEKRAFAKWGKVYAESARLLYDPPLIYKLSSVLTTIVSSIGTVVIYHMAIGSNISTADYYAFQSAYGLLLGAFTSVTSIATAYAQIKPMYELVRPILEAEPEVQENKPVISRISGGVDLSRVTFAYDGCEKPVLDDISIRIKPGEYVAVVGKTGCGKSTLIKLLLGFIKPQKGAVFYDNKDLKTFDVRSLRKKIGVVMQNSKLFSGDVYSNIVISAPQLTVDEAWEAAEIAGIADDIRRMPMGMYTYITEGSGGISGGQRQRIAIARAIAPKPKILIFDEATSALDNITQKKVSEALDGLKCTRIVVAHRLSTIRNCDRIIVLDNGHIIEEGTFEDLLAKKGFFAELVERQMVEEDKE